RLHEATTLLSIGSKKLNARCKERLVPRRVSVATKKRTRVLKMQFLVYVTLLMVSISTVLLEVHWLASPEPRLNPTVQTRAVQTPKTEGSNTGVRTVYPDPSRPLEIDSQVQTIDAREAARQTPATNTAVQPTHLPWPSPASTPQASPSEQSMPA